MLRSIYTSISSMITNQQRQNVVANNLANSNTIGYKSEKILTKSFDEINIVNYDNYINGKQYGKEIGKISLGLSIDETITSFEQGTIVATDNKMDMAIQGEGFFTVEDEQGNRFYTRDGNFRTDVQGYLTTNEGYYVLGNNIETNNTERINLGNSNLNVSKENIISIDDVPSYKFNIVRFDNMQEVNKIGDNLYQAQNGINVDTTIIQGSLESSNVNIISESNDMIMYSREYEACQKVIQTIDSTLDKIANEIGAVR